MSSLQKLLDLQEGAGIRNNRPVMTPSKRSSAGSGRGGIGICAGESSIESASTALSSLIVGETSEFEAEPFVELFSRVSSVHLELKEMKSLLQASDGRTNTLHVAINNTLLPWE